MEAIGNNQGPRNPNGCPVSATFFVSTEYNDYSLTQRMYNQGNEIATHTMNHYADPSAREIIGAVQALSAWGGVPKKDIIGFRTPFLAYSTNTFKFVRGSGLFAYDSSINMDPNDAYWPYTLDNGPVNECRTGTCEPGMKIPGLWEIPMYQTLNVDGSINTSMEPRPIPGTDSQDVNLPTKAQIAAMYVPLFSLLPPINHLFPFSRRLIISAGNTTLIATTTEPECLLDSTCTVLCLCS